jgi:hypothetical protein
VLTVPSPLGEVVDRLVILGIKLDHVKDGRSRTAVAALRDALARTWDDAGLPPWSTLPEHAALVEVNAALWDVEDTLREHELRADFGPTFVEHARSVYRLNDRRAALKADIDRMLGSSLHEPKLHP